MAGRFGWDRCAPWKGGGDLDIPGQRKKKTELENFTKKNKKERHAEKSKN